MKLLIVGGVAGGATAAARARRLNEHAEIILFERGEFISFANCGLPYYIGDIIKKRQNLLVTTADDFRNRYAIDVRVFCEVASIDRSAKTVTVKNLESGKTYTETYDKLMLAPGAEPVKPPLAGIELENIFNLRNIPDMDRIKAFVDRNKPESAVVVGGGFIGLEMAENLVHRGVGVTIVERLEHVMPLLDHEMAGLVQGYLEEKRVDCIRSDGIKSFAQDGKRLAVETEKGRRLVCDLAIVCVGIRPENRLAKDAGLEIGPMGGIRVDASMRTSDPDIYAVGDATEIFDYLTGRRTTTPLAGPANKQGRIAADNIMGRSSTFKGTLGTSVVKIFDATLASTGLSEKILKARDIPYLVSYTHSGSHASYYPGAEMMAIKLLFAPNNGRILGAQIFGREGVDKRIDVIATAIHGSMTVFHLEELELAYAPPYSSAKDPVNIAGFAAANLIRGDVRNINWEEFTLLDPENDVLLDVRNRDELKQSGKINGALHIPLHELRSRLSGLDSKKRYIPFCAVGLRGYIAHRILIQSGFDSRNLSGGFKTLMGAQEKLMAESPGTPLWLGE
ncbi:MAG: CoA-disulfide reductase [Desulfobacteraceae bacterium]|nr:MAG: CoA-disulfide reductase [Desulfobacteraceae bacterium]